METSRLAAFVVACAWSGASFSAQLLATVVNVPGDQETISAALASAAGASAESPIEINNYAKAPVPCDYINYSASVTAANNAVTKLAPSIAFGENCLEVADGEPLFKRAEKGSGLPAKGSVLINQGALLDWMTAESLDVLGKPRLSQGVPDIGACEFQVSGFQVFLR